MQKPKNNFFHKAGTHCDHLTRNDGTRHRTRIRRESQRLGKYRLRASCFYREVRVRFSNKPKKALSEKNAFVWFHVEALPWIHISHRKQAHSGQHRKWLDWKQPHSHTHVTLTATATYRVKREIPLIIYVTVSLLQVEPHPVVEACNE